MYMWTTSHVSTSIIFPCDHTCTPQVNTDTGLQEPGPKKPRTAAEIASSSEDMMTSKDYYFDSYSHFGKSVTLLVWGETPTFCSTDWLLPVSGMCGEWKGSGVVRWLVYCEGDICMVYTLVHCKCRPVVGIYCLWITTQPTGCLYLYV